MKTITRVRKIKNRFGFTNGPCFVGLHLFKHSWYVGKPVRRLTKGSRLKAIKDTQGLELITGTGDTL